MLRVPACLSVLAAACAVVACGATTTCADVVRLHSGAELRGKIATPVKIAADGTIAPTGNDAATPASPLVIETLSGARVEISAEAVAFVSRRPLNVEHYELRARHLQETADAHWELAQWCREQRLTEQHDWHCSRVVLLAPEHEAAHRALGHVWKDDAWVDWDQYMTERGYVKHRGRWITQQEFDLLEKTAAELAREQEWYPKIRLWTTWLSGAHAERAEKGFAALRAVQDVDATPAVVRLMGKHPVRDIRLLAVQVLTQSMGAKSATALAEIVLTDADSEVRFAALQGIPVDQFASAQPYFILKLKSQDNAHVNRAAVALQRVGNTEAVTPLINALITTHRYSVTVRAVPGNAYSFGTNGTFGNPGVALPPDIEAGLRTGQYPNGVIVLPPSDPGLKLPTKVITVQRDEQNPEVLAALRKLTGEDFQYDERTWHLWWSAQKHVGGISKS